MNVLAHRRNFHCHKACAASRRDILCANKMETECDSEFWNQIENEIKESIPTLVKILLTKCGYNSRTCLRKITLEDIITVERFVTDNCKEMLKHVKIQPEYVDFKINRAQSFEFLPGHRKFIVNMGEILTIHKDTKRTRHETEEWQQPLSEDLSARLKNLLCNNIVKWATNKKLHESVCICKVYDISAH